MHGYEGWHMGGMWIGWILIIAALAAVIWFAVNRGYRGSSRSEESPEQTLKRRYAEGEIDREQYDRMLLDLRK